MGAVEGTKGHVGDGDLEFPPKREAGGGDPLSMGRKLPSRASLMMLTSPWAIKVPTRKIKRQPGNVGAKAKKEEPATGRSLRTEEASLPRGKSHLSHEIPGLQLELPHLPDAHGDPVTQLQKQLFEAEMAASRWRRNFNVWRSRNSVSRVLDVHREMPGTGRSSWEEALLG